MAITVDELLETVIKEAGCSVSKSPNGWWWLNFANEEYSSHIPTHIGEGLNLWIIERKLNG